MMRRPDGQPLDARRGRAHSTSRSSSSAKCASELVTTSATPSGAEHPAQLGDRERPIGHVVQHVHRERDVEAVVGERQRLRVD